MMTRGSSLSREAMVSGSQVRIAATYDVARVRLAAHARNAMEMFFQFETRGGVQVVVFVVGECRTSYVIVGQSLNLC